MHCSSLEHTLNSSVCIHMVCLYTSVQQHDMPGQGTVGPEELAFRLNFTELLLESGIPTLRYYCFPCNA
jgi:hypothetical protein